MQTYGIAFCGLPGSGKTTLAHNMRDIMGKINRPCALVNLDPAGQEEDFDFNVQEIVQVYEAMDLAQLGPNGALLYCLRFLEQHCDLLIDFMTKNANKYFIIDLPGQIECYAADYSLRNIFNKLRNDLGFELCVVGLADAMVINTASKYMQLCLTQICTSIAFDKPFISLMNKVDLMRHDPERVFEEFSYQLDEEQDELGKALLDLIDRSGCQELAMMSALDSKMIVRLIVEADSRIGYQRGILGEYKANPQQGLQIEDFIMQAFDEQ